MPATEVSSPRRLRYLVLTKRIKLGGVLLLVAGACGWFAIAASRPSSVPPESRESVLLISVDTLRADHLGAYGYRRSPSPFIDSVAAAGCVFLRAMTPFPATDPSHASLFTSLHPLRHGLLDLAVPLSRRPETVAEVYARHGYYTMGAVSVFHLGKAYHFDRGFDDYSDLGESGLLERDAEAVTQAAIDLVERYRSKSPSRPFFLFVHYFDPHAPYKDHEKGEVVAIDRGDGPNAVDLHQQGRLVDAYDSEIRFVDAHIQKLYRYLEKKGLARRLLACVTADHGEQLGEHGRLSGHADIYEETVHVPLIVWGGGVPRTVVEQRVSTTDIATTLAGYSGFRFKEAVDGRDLRLRTFTANARQTLNVEEKREVVLGLPRYTQSLGMFDGDWYYVWNLDASLREVALRPTRKVAAGATSERFVNLEPAPESTAQTRAFHLPVVGLAPATAVFRVEVVQSPCDANIELRPRTPYFTKPLRIDASSDLRVPLSGFQAVLLHISPGSCVGSVAYRYEGRGDAQAKRAASETRFDSDLFRGLLAVRKNTPTDELFELERDPSMASNLAGVAGARRRMSEFRNRLEADYWSLLWRSVDDQSTVPRLRPDEFERLKALGYIR